MYRCIRLTNKNFDQFKKIHSLRESFNNLNEDFFSIYKSANLVEQLILRRRVRILINQGKCSGYMWNTNFDKDHCIINSMNVVGENQTAGYMELISSLKNGLTIQYMCEKNDFNYQILKELGFTRREGTLKMRFNIPEEILIPEEEEIALETLIRGRQESIRCKIQNEVFKNDARIPLSVEDIYFDEMQDYYIGNGAILVKKDNDYIGYGQIILDDGNATIVNVGIIREFRGKGYGRALLYYLLRIVKNMGFNDAYIRVASNNTTALNLYRSIGFKEEQEIYWWELKK